MVADSDGLGAYLESYIRGIVEFHNGGSAFDKQYANLKTECAYKLAEVVNNKLMRVICTKEQEEKIKEELGVLKAVDVDNDTGKKNIISKDLMKQLLGCSPDYLDMLNMGMYHSVAPKPRVSKGIKKMVCK